MSLVLNSLHDLAAKTAPGTSQADGPCTPWACYLHSISMAASHYRLCLEDRVSSHLPKHHLPYKFRPVSPFLFEISSYHTSNLSFLGLNYHLESGTVFTILYLVFLPCYFTFVGSIFCLITTHNSLGTRTVCSLCPWKSLAQCHEHN